MLNEYRGRKIQHIIEKINCKKVIKIQNTVNILKKKELLSERLKILFSKGVSIEAAHACLFHMKRRGTCTIRGQMKTLLENQTRKEGQALKIQKN